MKPKKIKAEKRWRIDWRICQGKPSPKLCEAWGERAHPVAVLPLDKASIEQMRAQVEKAIERVLFSPEDYSMDLVARVALAAVGIGGAK